MAIHRAARPESNYAQIRNDVLRDERLSYRARGVLVTILSHADEWSTSAEDLARKGQEGRDAIRTCLSELEAAGYLTRERSQDKHGRWSTRQVIYDTPRQTPVQDTLEAFMAPTTDSQASVTDDGFPAVGSPAVGFSGANRTPLRTTLPTEGASASADPARAIAKAVYDAADGMVPFMGIVAIATKALKMTSKPSPAQVQEAMLGLLKAGRPITIQGLGSALNPSLKRTSTAPVSDWEERTSW